MLKTLIKKHKLAIAFLGDVGVFLLSIILILYVRYGNNGFKKEFLVHLNPFIIVLILWLIIFYISNLYTLKAFNNIIEISRRLLGAIGISFSITITIFYIFSRFFFLTPKANLVAFTIIFTILDIVWRYILRKIFIQKQHRSKVLIIANSPLIQKIIDYTNLHPQLGYSIHTLNSDITHIANIVDKNSINLIVISGQFLKNNGAAKKIYSLLPKQVEIILFTDFYESLFKKIPLNEIEEEWFIREITKSKNIYVYIKRFFEIIFALLFLIILFPIILIIIIMVGITSAGPIIYKQERIGKNDKPFTLYKFRTMKTGQAGPLWTTKNDDRLTPVGKILRYTHLDELPQLINILKGDISFIGPRPERTELVKLYGTIPYYNVRHIINPGITGWAQINFKSSSSIDEAQEKFEFDLYYLKNMSFVIDLFITLKTIRMFFKENK